MKAKVIHVNSDRLKELNWNVDKCIKREHYIKNEIFPLLSNNGFDCSFFDAVMIPDFVYDRRGSELYVKNYDKFIQFNDKMIKVGLNNNDPPRSYEIALFLGHYMLWNECVNNNESILIMEDDVLLTEKTSSYVSDLFKQFLNKKNKLLYLQSVSPSDPKHKKIYSNINLEKNDYYFKVSKKHNDFAGTCCYMITPSSAKILIDFVETFGVICIDGFIHNCHKYSNLDICIPLDYKNTAELHPEYC